MNNRVGKHYDAEWGHTYPFNVAHHGGFVVHVRNRSEFEKYRKQFLFESHALACVLIFFALFPLAGFVWVIFLLAKAVIQ